MLPRRGDTRGEMHGANGCENEDIADEEITISNDKEAQRGPKMQLKQVHGCAEGAWLRDGCGSDMVIMRGLA